MQAAEPEKARHSLSDWKVLLPYWVSDEKGRAFSLLGGTVLLSFLEVRVAVWFGRWDQQFFDSMFAYRVADCLGMVPDFLVGAVVLACSRVGQKYLTQVLSMRWRLWNTRVYLRRYLSGRAYYQLEHGLGRADNPDQRIADDLAQMTVWTLRLGLDGLQAVTTLLSFSVVLWEIGGPLDFRWEGWHVYVPGYMFVFTALVILAASLVLEKAGGPLIGANYRQQHFDADLRAGLLDVRRNSEQIAFYAGEEAENLRLSKYLANIAGNWRSVVRYTFRANMVMELYTGSINLVLWALLIPRLLAHALTMGLYSRMNSAFMNVRRSLQWFIENYTDLATLRSVLQRLREFEQVVGREEVGGIVRVPTEALAVVVKNLVLERPDGARMTGIEDLTIRPGERWMIRGASGVGKSTLLRALAGLWPYGRGTISFNSRQTLFLPQRSYLPYGTLRAALSYPVGEGQYSATRFDTVLEVVDLGAYRFRLDEVAEWGAVLSPGEGQRLAIARALLACPRVLFLDEATSALDAESERRLYGVLLEALPESSIISVAHHDSLVVFHDFELVVRSEGMVARALS